MRTITRAALAAVLGVTLMNADLHAADKPKSPEQGKAVPADTPLELTIEGTLKYTLPANAPTEEQVKRDIAVDKYPKPSAADLMLVLKNTSDKPVTVWVGGDPVTIDLSVKGEGVVSIRPRLAMTADFRGPKAVEVEAGKTVEIPLKQLSGGKRGMGEYWYWTKPGEHEVTAVLHTAVSPAPKGAEKADEGFGKVQVASKAVKITVEKK